MGRHELAALDYFPAVHVTIATAAVAPGAAEVAALPAREHRGAALPSFLLSFHSRAFD